MVVFISFMIKKTKTNVASSDAGYCRALDTNNKLKDFNKPLMQ